MKLDLRFTVRPLENLWCDTVIALVFQNPFRYGNDVFGLDRKTSGALTRLWKKGFLTGEKAETLLMAAQNMIRADKILLKGLGPHSDYGVECLGERVLELGNTLMQMTINDIAIRIPVAEDPAPAHGVYIESACTHLVDAFLMKHEKDDDFILKMVVTSDEPWAHDLESTIRHLKEYFMSKLDYTIIIDRTDFVK